MKKTFGLFVYFFITFPVIFAQSNDWDIAWNENGAKITAYRGNEREVSIPQQIAGLPVVGIGENVFANKRLESVVIPNNVAFIDSGAFAGNPLTSITIPANVTLGKEAIVNNFVEIYSNSGKKAGTYNYMSFGGVWAVIGWTTERGDGGFIITGYNGNDTAVTIPSKWGNFPIIGIQGRKEGYGGRSCFGEKSINSVIIPDGIILIGDYAFYQNQLTSVAIPNSVISIGNSAFANNRLTNITIPNSVISIGDEAFYINQLTSITIPDSVTSIGNWAFANNRLTNISIPNSVTSIGDQAFYNNPLIILNIGNGVIRIGYWVFISNQLTAITVPNQLDAISIPNGNSYLPLNSDFIMEYNNNGKKAGTYIRINNEWLLSATTLIEGATAIGEREYAYRDLTSFSVSNTCAFISNYAFQGNQLTSIIIPNSVISIGDGAFYGNQLSSLYLSDSLISIGNSAFSHNQLTSLIIPNSLTSIGDNAFSDNQLTSLVIPNNITLIGGAAFRNNQLTNIIIPDSVTSIGDFAFADNPITSITIPANLNLSNDRYNPVFPNGFDTFYKSNGAKAGTYTHINGIYWSYSVQ